LHLANVDVVEGSVPEQLPDLRFDLVYSSMTMHHVEDVPGLLRALTRHLNPGGRLALADLDAEDGGFHREAQGVVHHGFARDVMGGWLHDAGFADVAFSTAWTMRREATDGAARDYPIFLAVARKPER
jgi:SAM-dependent methyltransferase